MVRTSGYRQWRRAVLCALGVAALAFSQAAPPPERQPILDYIKQTWATLTRSNRTLAAAAADPKFQAGPQGRWPVYVPRDEDLKTIRQQLQRDRKSVV